MAAARELGMEPLVEVNAEDEMAIALAAGAKVIGVNNRNLHTFEVDMTTTGRMAALPAGSAIQLLALSGVTTRADVEELLAAKANGVLVGEDARRVAGGRDPIAHRRAATEDALQGVRAARRRGGGGGGRRRRRPPRDDLRAVEAAGAPAAPPRRVCALGRGPHAASARRARRLSRRPTTAAPPPLPGDGGRGERIVAVARERRPGPASGSCSPNGRARAGGQRGRGGSRAGCRRGRASSGAARPGGAATVGVWPTRRSTR